MSVVAKPYGTRAEHLAWCKVRAIEALEKVSLKEAYASMQSDMRKHDETRHHDALGLMSQLYIAGHLSTPEQMREFILGFN